MSTFFCPEHLSIGRISDKKSVYANCCGNEIEVDDSIAMVVLLLNKKGYITKFCCGGHVYSQGMYIMFAHKINFEIPRYWYKLANNAMYFSLKTNIDEVERELILAKERTNLLEWAKNLPDRGGING